MLNSSLQKLVYEYVCRSLFKADRLMFALHMVHGMFPELFKENVSGLCCRVAPLVAISVHVSF